MPKRKRGPMKQYRRVRRRKDTVKKVRRAVNKIKRQIEVKRTLTQTTDTSVTNNPPLQIVPQPIIADQGDGDNEFVGQKYFARGLKLRYTLQRVGASSVQVGRIVVIWVNKFPITDSFNFDTWFDPADDNSTAIPVTVASLRSSQVPNVKILYDRTYAFGDNEASFQIYHKSVYIPIQKTVTFNAGAFTSGRCLIYVMGGIDEAVNLNMMSKFYYSDL